MYGYTLTFIDIHSKVKIRNDIVTLVISLSQTRQFIMFVRNAAGTVLVHI